MFLNSHNKNMGVIIQIELFQLEGIYNNQEQLPDQCRPKYIYINIFPQVEILVQVYKIHKIKSNPLIPWRGERGTTTSKA